MYSWVTLDHLVRWTGGKVSGSFPSKTPVSHISTDSRTIAPGQVFAALKGDSFDGHDYLKDVAGKGAAALLVERPSDVKCPQIVVGDTLRALIAIGDAIRREFKGKVCAVTGSAGKSSTKDMIAALLGADTVASPASFNNLLGVSKTLFLVNDTTKQLVLEMGMNASGEIAEICRHFRPQAAAITNIGDAHIGKLGGQRAIQLAKKEIFDHIASLGDEAIGVVVNIDDRLVREAFEEAFPKRPRFLTYSDQGTAADVRIVSKAIDPDTGFLSLKIEIQGKILSERIPIFGSHQSQNIASAAAMATLLGVSIEDIRARLPQVRPAVHRGEVHRLAQESILIDESYNSNPTALLSALTTLFGLSPDRRRVLVLGDMLELGEFTERLHREVGEGLVRLKGRSGAPVVVIGVGTAVGSLLGPIKKAVPEEDCIQVADWEAALSLVRKRARPRDILFVKGSRGNKLDRLVAQVLAGN
jgi:UDP-N-acetylmuramoyl-tripeptide--D-alanyl-D-alanine ligase